MARRASEEEILHVVCLCFPVSSQCFPLGSQTGDHKAKESVYATQRGQPRKGAGQGGEVGERMWMSGQNTSRTPGRPARAEDTA